MRRALLTTLLAGCSFNPTSATGDPDGPVAPDTPPIDAPAGAWLAGWSHRKAITIAANQVAGPLTDFPVVLSLTDPEIIAIARSDGADLAVTGDDAMTELAVDLERYTVGSNTIVLWVKVPALSNATDTRLYLYYGNPSANQGGGQDVWTNQFAAAWQLRDTPSGNGSLHDDTAGSHDGDTSNMNASNRIDGQVGFGLTFNGNDERIVVPSAIDLGDSFTISAWIRMKSDGQIQTIFSNCNSGLDRNGWKLFVNDENTSSHRLIFESSDGNPSNARKLSTDTNKITRDQWDHVAVTIDRANRTGTLFINGADQSSTTATTTATSFASTSQTSFIGQMGDQYFFGGDLDQLELATTRRSPEWIGTAFKNQVSPSTFHAVGPQELDPNRAASLRAGCNRAASLRAGCNRAALRAGGNRAASLRAGGN